MKEFTKDPTDILDYKFDWKSLTNGSGPGDYLQTNETILSHLVTVSAGLTLDSSAITDTNTTVTAWISGGSLGNSYTVSCKIVTSLSRTVERSIVIRVKSQ